MIGVDHDWPSQLRSESPHAENELVDTVLKADDSVHRTAYRDFSIDASSRLANACHWRSTCSTLGAPV